MGKTSMMQEAVEAIEANGTQVFTFAPSARASRGVLRDKGFETADTVARLLQDEKLQQQLKGQVIWIDEAGLAGTRTMSAVFELAEKFDARVVLSGDRRQHGSVERGLPCGCWRTKPVSSPPKSGKSCDRKSSTNRRLRLSEDRVIDGFKKLDDLKWIREVPDADRYRPWPRITLRPWRLAKPHSWCRRRTSKGNVLPTR